MLAKIEKHIREHGLFLHLYACEISLSSGIFQLPFLGNEYILHPSIYFKRSEIKVIFQNYLEKSLRKY